MVLRRARPHDVEEVDWDRIRFRSRDGGRYPATRTLRLDDPLGHTRATTEAILEGAGSLGGALDTLGARHDEPESRAAAGSPGTAGAHSETAATTGRPASGWPHHGGGRNGHEIS
jgi:hypothetical protein